MRKWNGRCARIAGTIVIGIGAAICLLLLPLRIWLMISGITFIIIGIHMYRSC